MGELWQHFTNAFKRENYARMGGRATRTEYWSCMLFALLFGCVPLALTLAGAVVCVVSAAAGTMLLIAGAAAMLFYVFYTALPMLAVYVRRLHDVNWSGRWIALQYGIIAIMMLLETALLLRFQVEQEIVATDLPAMDLEEISSLAGEFAASAPAWFNVCCRVADPALTALAILLFVLTLLPTGPDNQYGPRS